MTQGIVFQVEQVFEDAIQYTQNGRLSGYISIFHKGKWWQVPIGPSFMNLGFNEVLPTIETEGKASTQVTFRCNRLEGLQIIQIGDISELLVPLADFNAGVAKALGVVALPV